MKLAFTYTTCLREIVSEVTWIVSVVARSIKSCPVLTREQSLVVLHSSFFLVKVYPMRSFF